MLRTTMAAGVMAATLAGAAAQAPGPGAGPQDPGTSTAQNWGMAAPLGYLGLIALGGGAVLWYAVRGRGRRG